MCIATRTLVNLRMASVAENLRRLRKASGLSQVALAEKARVSQQLISQLERGENAKTLELPSLALALGVDVQDIDEDFNINSERTVVTPVPLISTISAGTMMRDDLFDEAIETLSITKLPPGDWFALKVEGDSMDRISPPDSIILVNRKDKRLVNNACYIISDQHGNATYKRYRPNPDRFEPVSNNPNHEPIFPDNDVPVVGRVKRTMLEM